MDILGRGIFANDHFAFLYAMLRINRHQHTIALDVDDELPQFEIIAQRFVQQAARMQDRSPVGIADDETRAIAPPFLLCAGPFFRAVAIATKSPGALGGPGHRRRNRWKLGG